MEIIAADYMIGGLWKLLADGYIIWLEGFGIYQPMAM